MPCAVGSYHAGHGIALYGSQCLMLPPYDKHRSPYLRIPKADSIHQPSFGCRPRAQSEAMRKTVVGVKFGRDAGTYAFRRVLRADVVGRGILLSSN